AEPADRHLAAPLELARDEAVRREEQVDDLGRARARDVEPAGYDADQLLLVHGDLLGVTGVEYHRPRRRAARPLARRRPPSRFASSFPKQRRLWMHYGSHPGWIEVISGVMFAGK